MPFMQWELREASLNALVRVAESLFELQRLFADDRKAKVAGFDDARMHRPHWNLMHAIALDAHERVVIEPRARRRRMSVLQWMKLRGPGRVSGSVARGPDRSASARCMRFAAGNSSSIPG